MQQRSARTEAKGTGLELFTQTSKGTPMGDFLRRFWQPVAAVAEVSKGGAIPIRLLSEDLTLYRGESGNPHVVAARCAHRLNLLHTGWVEDEQIRCMYHGWMYNGTGQCVEMPAEDASFAPKIKIAGYPTQEYSGLIFVYMGEGEPPEFDLPRNEELERPENIRWINNNTWPCNWFQSVENSLDAAHVSFVHRWGKLGAFGGAVTDLLPKLEYVETEAGIRQTAIRSETNVRISDWTFPNHNHIVVPGLDAKDPWTHTIPWMVPMDDEHMLRIAFQSSRVQGAGAERLKEYLLTHGYEATETANLYFGKDSYNPADHREELFRKRAVPEPRTNELTAAQDYVAQVGQGSIVDRSVEHLGQSDAGVILLRKIFERELSAMGAGRPCKQWKRQTNPLELPTQQGKTPGKEGGWDRKGVTAAT